MWFKNKKKVSEDTKEQAILIGINLNSITEFGESEQREKLRILEDKLKLIIDKDSEVDGHEIGEGIATLYLYSKNADKLWSIIVPELKHSDFDAIDITIRYGSVDNPTVKQKQFSL